MVVCVEYTLGVCKCTNNGGEIGASPAHTCLYCNRGIHAICGNQPTVEELQAKHFTGPVEGSGSKRICSSCFSADEIRHGRLTTGVTRSCLTAVNVEEFAQPSDMSRDYDDTPIARWQRSSNPGIERVISVKDTTKLGNKRVRYDRASKPSDFEEMSDFDGDDNSIGSSDSEFAGEDYDSTDSSDSEDGNYQPYAWVELDVKSKNIEMEIDELDGFVYEIMYSETLSVLEKTSRRLGKGITDFLRDPPTPVEALDMVLTDTVLCTLADAASIGLQCRGIEEQKAIVTKKEMSHYIECLLLCGIFDESPTYVLSDRDAHLFYHVEEIRERIDLSRFKQIRNGLNSCLGHEGRSRKGVSWTIWRNPKMDIPASINYVQQAISAASSAIGISLTSTILGMDDEHLRYASRHRRKHPYRAGDREKGIGIHGTSKTTTLSCITLGLHNSVKGETVSEILTALLMAATQTPVSRWAAERMKGSILALDRAYSTSDVIKDITNGRIPVSFIATMKNSSAHPVTFGRKEPKEWEKKLSSTGMRELIVFQRSSRGCKPAFAIGYRDIGNHEKAALLQFSGVDIVSPFPFSLKPRNRVSWKKDVEKMARSPQNLIRDFVSEQDGTSGVCWIVAHEFAQVNLLTYAQALDQAWWLLRTAGVTSTLSFHSVSCAIDHMEFIESKCADSREFRDSLKLVACALGVGTPVRRQPLFEPWNHEPRRRRRGDNCGEDRGTVRRQGTVRKSRGHAENSTRVKSMPRNISHLKRPELQELCREKGFPHMGTKMELIERIRSFMQEDSQLGGPQEQEERENGMRAQNRGRVEGICITEEEEICSILDEKMFCKPRKGSKEQESGSLNEPNILRAVQEGFRRGEVTRTTCGLPEDEKIVAVVERGLVQNKLNQYLLASVYGIAAIVGSNGVQIVPVECKTRHGIHQAEAEIWGRELGESRYCSIRLRSEDLSRIQNYRLEPGQSELPASIQTLLKFVPDSAHSVQIHHHMAVYNSTRCLYVVASPNHLIYVVDILDCSENGIAPSLGKFLNALLRSGGEKIFQLKSKFSDEFERQSFFQNRSSRRLHFGLRHAALRRVLQQYEPLPESKYIRPTPVRAWNELGKIGTDNLSRQMVEIFPKRVSTRAGISKVAHRQIGVIIVNALYLWRLCRTAYRESAGSEDSLRKNLTDIGYAKFRRKMSRSIDMNSFIRAALLERGLPRSRPSIVAPRTSTSGVTVIEPITPQGPSTPSRKLRAHEVPTRKNFITFFNSDTGRKLRLTGKHVPVVSSQISGRSNNGKTCWLCAPKGGAKTGRSQLEKRSRTKTMCIQCYSPFLCTVIRYYKRKDGKIAKAPKSCFDEFHSAWKISKKSYVNIPLKAVVNTGSDEDESQKSQDNRTPSDESNSQLQGMKENAERVQRSPDNSESFSSENSDCMRRLSETQNAAAVVGGVEKHCDRTDCKPETTRRTLFPGKDSLKRLCNSATRVKPPPEKRRKS